MFEGNARSVQTSTTQQSCRSVSQASIGWSVRIRAGERNEHRVLLSGSLEKNGISIFRAAVDFSGCRCSSGLGALARDVVIKLLGLKSRRVFRAAFVDNAREKRGVPKTLRPVLLEPASHPSPQA